MRCAAFEHQHALARAREISGAREAIVPGADDQRVPAFGGEFVDRRGQADEAEGMDGRQGMTGDHLNGTFSIAAPKILPSPGS